MSGVVTFDDFRADDAMQLALQPSQWVQAGIEARDMTIDQARDLEGRGAAWTARAADGRILCCAGLRELFARRHALAWAMLATDLGVRQHLAITRFARARITRSFLVRIECLVEADAAGRCAKWAMAAGLMPRAVLPGWGADSQTVILFDRVREMPA